MTMSTPASSSKQLQIRLLTWQDELALPTTALSVPAKLDPDGLNKLVRGMLKDDKGEDAYNQMGLDSRKFDFLLCEDFVRGTLQECLSLPSAQSAGLTEETVLEIRYLDSRPPPEPLSSSDHDDWVGGVASGVKHVLTACYDGTVNIFEVESGSRKLTIPGHSGPAKAVAWISTPVKHGETSVGTFASASHDQTVMLYQWDVDKNTVDAMNVCKGHERSVDCLQASPSASLLASGSFDATLKIWGTKISSRNDEDDESGESSKGEKSKRPRTDSKCPTRTPIMTLAGHKEGVSGVAWTESDSEVATCSWDHTIKLWDVGELRGIKSELVGDRSFFGLSYSKENGTIITAAADSAIRLYDPRSKDGVLVRSRFTSHSGWVTSVSWRRGDENAFSSCGHDNLVKVWDRRSCRTPLFDLSGHADRVLDCCWDKAEFVASGGTDNSLKIFKTPKTVTSS